MESAVSVIKLMPANKSEQNDFARQLLSHALSGDVNPLELEVYLKSIEDTIKLVRKNIEYKGALELESDKFPGKEFDFAGATITKMSRTTMDYSNDEEWIVLDAKKKAREKTLKGLDKPMADPNTGEIINPPIKKFSEYLKIQYK